MYIYSYILSETHTLELAYIRYYKETSTYKQTHITNTIAYTQYNTACTCKLTQARVH
jgi:hypothetical protein